MWDLLGCILHCAFTEKTHQSVWMLADPESQPDMQPVWHLMQVCFGYQYLRIHDLAQLPLILFQLAPCAVHGGCNWPAILPFVSQHEPLS